jgi:rhodanese-related sulfurtransferase
MTRSIGELVILTSVSVLIGLCVNLVSPWGIPLFGKWDSQLGAVHAGGRCAPQTVEVPEDQILSAYIDLEHVLFVDARIEEDYVAGHIPGSMSFPLNRLEEILPSFMESYPFDKQLVIYCSGIDCTDSHDLATHLKELGYQSVRVYSRGYDGWLETGRPVKEGLEP